MADTRGVSDSRFNFLNQISIIFPPFVRSPGNFFVCRRREGVRRLGIFSTRARMAGTRLGNVFVRGGNPVLVHSGLACPLSSVNLREGIKGDY